MAAVHAVVVAAALGVVSLDLEVEGVVVVQLEVLVLRLELGAADLVESEVELGDLAGHLEMAVMEWVEEVTAESEVAAF